MAGVEVEGRTGETGDLAGLEVGEQDSLALGEGEKSGSGPVRRPLHHGAQELQPRQAAVQTGRLQQQVGLVGSEAGVTEAERGQSG